MPSADADASGETPGYTAGETPAATEPDETKINLFLEIEDTGIGIPKDQQDAIFFLSSVMYRPGKLLRAGGANLVGTVSGATQTIDIAASLTLAKAKCAGHDIAKWIVDFGDDLTRVRI